MAGKPKFTVSELISVIVAAQGDLTEVARSLGINRRTVVGYTQRYPKIKEAYDQEREKMLDRAEANLRKRLEGRYWPATKFALKTLGKSRGYTERTELTGAEGKPLEIEHSFKESLDKIYGEEEEEE